jgi:3',5'-cyclic AMP phosphodiesterase CpdA
MRTIVHVSDIHFGRTERNMIDALLASVLELAPDLVVISGDLTQRARIREFKEAAEFIAALKQASLSCLVIPGNHDIHPLHHIFPRIFRPYKRYRQYIQEDIEPCWSDDCIAVRSVNTVRASSIKDGTISRRQIEEAKKWFSDFRPGVIKIIVTHHPLDLPATLRKKLAKRAGYAVRELSECNVDAYLSGHYHQSGTAHAVERYADLPHPALAIQAGTVSLRIRRETQSFNVLSVGQERIRVDVYAWDQATSRFIRVEHASST